MNDRCQRQAWLISLSLQMEIK